MTRTGRAAARWCVSMFAGNDARLRRLLRYWCATCLFYLIAIVALWVEAFAGLAVPEAARMLTVLGVGGIAGFYLLVRLSNRLRLAGWQLAALQAAYALASTMAGYAVAGPLRGAALVVLLVLIVFSTFSLRARQMAALCCATLAAMALTMGALAARDPLHFPPVIEALHFALGATAVIAVTALTGVMSGLRMRLRRQRQELLEALATINTLATLDELTALANRRHMNEVLRAEEQRVNQQPGAVCIALLDIDYFKSVNDRYGHACGDAVLRAFADMARAELRAGDVLARWGGEEFLLMLPDTGLAEAQAVLARMAARFSAAGIPGVDSSTRVSFSAGLVEHRHGEPFSDTILRADKAMYEAKSTGRDRIVTH